MSERVNSIMFSLLWGCAPVLVSIVSFTVFVMLGNKMTVPIAFTVGEWVRCIFDLILVIGGRIVQYVAVGLDMVPRLYVHSASFRQPLNIIPSWIVQVSTFTSWTARDEAVIRFCKLA